MNEQMLLTHLSGSVVSAWVGPVVIALVYVSLCSCSREPNRRNFNAVLLSGAGAAYLNGGFGPWELAFTALVTACAYRGLRSYGFIGVGWLLHTGWDVLHHCYGHPIIPFAQSSSFGCAVCDPFIALWCFLGAPSTRDVIRGRRPAPTPASGVSPTDK